MTTPRALLSGRNGVVELNDGVHVNEGYLAPYAGLMEPAGHPKGAAIETFGGFVRVQPQATHYVPRSFTLDPCYLVGGNGLAELQRRKHDFWEWVKGRPSKLQIGSLELKVNLDPPQYKQRFESTTHLEFMLSGEALPALWLGMYGYAVGTSQSIVVVDDRLDHASLKFADVSGNGNVFTLANPGTAPTSVALMISGLTASTTYYLRNVDQDTGRRVAFTTAASGSTSTAWFLPAAAGLVVVPGTNTIRIEASAGTLITPASAFKVAIVPYQTTWQFLGNEADRFNEGPAVFTHYRRGLATYHSAAGTVTTADDQAARIGVPFGGWTAALAGLVLEGSSTNKFLQSEDIANGSWSSDSAPTFASSATLLPNGGTAQEVTDNDSLTHEGRFQTATSANGEVWTVSAWFKNEALGGSYPALRLEFTGGGTPLRVHAYIDVVNGTGTTESMLGGATGTVKVSSAGSDYWRVSLTVTNNSTGNTTVGGYYYPAMSTNGTIENVAAQGTKTVGGLQLEQKPWATSYIKTTTAAVTRNVDIAAAWLPHNYLRYSRDLTQNVAQTTDSSAASDLTKWIRRGTTAIVASTRNTTVADATATGTTVTSDATTDSIFQIVTPDIRPNSSVWTFVVAVRKPAGNPTSTDIKLKTSTGGVTYDAFSATVATTTITWADIPDATSTRTYFVQGTPGATAANLMVEIIGNTGFGDIIVEACGLQRGTFPGPIVLTDSSNLPLPLNGYDWPDHITQNGYIEFDAVLPPISTGLTYYLFGDAATQAVAIYRASAELATQAFFYVARKNNNAVRTDEVSMNEAVPSIWNGALHTFKLWWRNYTTSGTQTMTYGVDVDGTNKFTSSNLASATVTSWATPERLWLSDGNSYVTMRNFDFGAYAVPAGSIPAAVTA